MYDANLLKTLASLLWVFRTSSEHCTKISSSFHSKKLTTILKTKDRPNHNKRFISILLQNNMVKIRLYMMLFIRAMLLFALIGSYLNQRWLVFFVSLVSLFVTFLPTILHKTLGIKIPGDFEILILLFIYGTLFFGEVRGFYDRFWWWDILLNLGSSIALGLVGLTILYVLYKDEQLDASPLIIAIFTFTFAVAVGNLWEFFEFFMDTFFNFSMQQSSLRDTMTDLIVNAIGATIVAIAGYIYLKQGKRNILSKLIINFIDRNPILFRSVRTEDLKVDKLKRLISNGESAIVEFKSTLRTNLHTAQFDKNIEHSTLKTISAYLNSEGGTLLIGISDSGHISGTLPTYPSSSSCSIIT